MYKFEAEKREIAEVEHEVIEQLGESADRVLWFVEAHVNWNSEEMNDTEREWNRYERTEAVNHKIFIFSQNHVLIE